VLLALYSTPEHPITNPLNGSIQPAHTPARYRLRWWRERGRCRIGHLEQLELQRIWQGRWAGREREAAAVAVAVAAAAAAAVAAAAVVVVVAAAAAAAASAAAERALQPQERAHAWELPQAGLKPPPAGHSPQ